MIPISDPALFQISLEQLRRHKRSVGRSFKGRLIQLFLGLKFYQDRIPSIRSGGFVAPREFEMMLDDLYLKASRPAQSGVLILFEGSFLPRTATRVPGHKDAQNTWRNNLYIQKGVGCYAPATALADPAFLGEPRDWCRFLQRAAPEQFAGSTCGLCKAGHYRNELHPKWVRMDPGGSGYAAIDSSDIANFAEYVAPQGKRIPVLPLIVAIYHDAFARHGSGPVGIADLLSDFHLSSAEFATYFDDSPENRFNKAILDSAGDFEYSRGIPPTVPLKTRPEQTPVLTETIVPPPQHNDGWGAQQCVMQALVAAGWKVHDVSGQQLGYDLHAGKGRRTILVEVKSSVATCTPSLTSREWEKAKEHGARYVLAVIENFSASGENRIHWVPDPATTCTANPVPTLNFSIARSVWSTAVRALPSIK